MSNLGNSLGSRSIPPAFNWIVDPLVLNPFLYFDGSENVTTAGGAVSAWAQVTAGTNQLSRTFAQGTASLQPDNATEKSIDFDGTDDKLAFNVAVAQAGILICATNNGIFAFEVDADSVDEITALGFETGYFQDLDLFAMVLLPTTATDTQIAGVIKYLERETGATKNPTGDIAHYWRSRTDLVTPKLDGVDFSGVTALVSCWQSCTSLASFPKLDLSRGTNFSNSWRGCTALASFPALNLSGGTSFNSAWYGNSSLATFGECTFSTDPDVDINFKSAWLSCQPALTTFPTLDLSRGTNFLSTWYDCRNMLEFPSGTTFSTTATDDIDFTEAWWGCRAFTTFPALDLSRGTDFEAAWRYCVAMTSFGSCTFSDDAGDSISFFNAWRDTTSLATFPSDLELSRGDNFHNAWWNSRIVSFPAFDLSNATTFNSAFGGNANMVSFGACNMNLGRTFYAAWYTNTALTTFPAGVFDSWNPASVDDNCFAYAWDNCSALTATSVENILNSLATAGVAAPSSGVDITIAYNASSGTPSVASAVATLKGLSPAWTITLNGVAQ